MISSFQGDVTSTTITVARRDVFDIRAQLMVEDSAEDQNGELIAGLEKGDIKPNFYEGGFKTWECSIDLGRLVAGEEMGDSDRHVVEVGFLALFEA
jgi:protein-histidine N-methyltransferase